MKSTFSGKMFLAAACLLIAGAALQAAEPRLGPMRADKILFLGNSITSCGPKYWGLSATTAEKDYAHRLAAAIDAKTGGHLELVRQKPQVRKPDGALEQSDSNVINIADVFERGYATYKPELLHHQLDRNAGIVVLQFGENIPMQTFKAKVFKSSLQRLFSDLKAHGNPYIFVPSYILGGNAVVDGIKREVCAEDPAHRIFVDLSMVHNDAANMGEHAHPNDKGMALIADLLFKAMEQHAARP